MERQVQDIAQYGQERRSRHYNQCKGQARSAPPLTLPPAPFDKLRVRGLLERLRRHVLSTAKGLTTSGQISVGSRGILGSGGPGGTPRVGVVAQRYCCHRQHEV